MAGEKEAVGTDHLALPYEKGGESPADTHKGILASLESELSDETEGDEEPAADEGDELESAEGSEEEESSEDESEEDDEPGDEEDEEPEAEPVFEVDGEKVTLQELKSGRLRQADYTRKTQALAEDRRKVEAESGELRQQRDAYARGLESLALALKEQQPKEPDWDKLRQENPGEYAAQFADFQRYMGKQAEVEAEQMRVFGERRSAWEKEQDTLLRAETERLHEAIPAWKDETVAQAEKAKLVEYLTTTGGWTVDDVASVSDHRLMLALRKAMLYDEGQTKGKEKLQGKVKAASVLKPGAQARSQKPGPKSVKRAAEKLRRTGRPEDAAALFEHFLPD